MRFLVLHNGAQTTIAGLWLLSLLLMSTNAIGQQEAVMILIPGGEYTMGKDINNDMGFSPSHTVKVDSFFIDPYEVTNWEYLRFCRATGYRMPEFWNTDVFKSGEKFPDHPVVGVTHGDAQKYAEWAGKRLPTEAEWEYASRGGLTEKDYPNGNEWNKERVKQDGTGWKNFIEPVGSHEPNGYGLFDMSGNVWEWVADRYSETYYQVRDYDNPIGPKKGSNNVIRGGSWHSGAMCKKVYYRKGLISTWCDFSVGFRCVKDKQ